MIDFEIINAKIERIGTCLFNKYNLNPKKNVTRSISEIPRNRYRVAALSLHRDQSIEIIKSRAPVYYQ